MFEHKFQVSMWLNLVNLIDRTLIKISLLERMSGNRDALGLVKLGKKNHY